MGSTYFRSENEPSCAVFIDSEGNKRGNLCIKRSWKGSTASNDGDQIPNPSFLMAITHIMLSSLHDLSKSIISK